MSATSARPASDPFPFRVGQGYDIHRIQPGGKLFLGGVLVSESMSPIAHSDGDVVLHALCDAIIGGMGWGDIGDLFPITEGQWKGAASSGFVEVVEKRLRQEGWYVTNADLTIIAERPRLAPHKKKMVETIAALLGPKSRVNVKACTNEECDALGRGEAIAASAIVMLAAAGSSQHAGARKSE